MMPHDAFRAPWKFLAQLFGEFGRISKIGVVNIDVPRDDCSIRPRTRFAVSRFSTQIGRSNS
jgi:hypothetical protein